MEQQGAKMTITNALISLSEALGKRGFDIIDLGCDDDEDTIIYALQYMENHLSDILADQIEIREGQETEVYEEHRHWMDFEPES
jgi:hypothetical protein